MRKGDIVHALSSIISKYASAMQSYYFAAFSCGQRRSWPLVTATFEWKREIWQNQAEIIGSDVERSRLNALPNNDCCLTCKIQRPTVEKQQRGNRLDGQPFLLATAAPSECQGDFCRAAPSHSLT
jgi:hypothetical protein